METKQIKAMEKQNIDKIIQLQAKILLAKAIIKNWDKTTEREKKTIKQWWKETYGEFKDKK